MGDLGGSAAQNNIKNTYPVLRLSSFVDGNPTHLLSGVNNRSRYTTFDRLDVSLHATADRRPPIADCRSLTAHPWATFAVRSPPQFDITPGVNFGMNSLKTYITQKFYVILCTNVLICTLTFERIMLPDQHRIGAFVYS
jgi:hypothetical protein